MICLYFPTLRCNDTCEFCPAWKGYPDIRESESGDQGIRISEKFRELRRRGIRKLVVTGGEPLLREDLPAILKQAKEQGFEIELFTNGILYPDRASELKGLAKVIYFSLDYPFAEDHDRSRGVESFNRVLAGIRLAQTLKEKPVIYYTLTRDSVRFLPEAIELAGNFRVRLFLNPVYDFEGLHGFEPATYEHILYYKRRKSVIINLAAIEFLKRGGNNTAWPRCHAKETVITLLPDLSEASPCFYNRGGKQGREPVCSGCTRWPYMLPSFTKGLDLYYFLNLYSDWMNRRKEK